MEEELLVNVRCDVVVGRDIQKKRKKEEKERNVNVRCKFGEMRRFNVGSDD